MEKEIKNVMETVETKASPFPSSPAPAPARGSREMARRVLEDNEKKLLGKGVPSPPCLLPVLLPPQARLPPLAPPVPPSLSPLSYSLSNIPSRPPPLSSSPLGSQPPGLLSFLLPG